MSRRISALKAFLVVFTIVIDAYTFVGLGALLNSTGPVIRFVFPIVFWIITVIFLGLILWIPRFDTGKRDPAGLSHIFWFVGIYFLFFLPKLVFVIFRLVEDIIRFLSWLISLFMNQIFHLSLHPAHWSILSFVGIGFSIILFFAILLGIIFGRFKYLVEKTEIEFRDLPQELNDLRIVQLSDVHLGSAYGKQDKVKRAVSIINGLEPDLVLFTGDLVNNYSEEAIGWEDLFASIKAKYGKFSILGNHDYGDYWEWKSEDEQRRNMEMLFNIHRKMGFDLLRNSQRLIQVKNEKLALIGVENWGKPPFKQYGDLELSIKGLPSSVFKILLSHDPSHWDAEVITKTDIQLTLSGHTHAMQFGFRIGKFQWSPSGYLYKRWMGLYRVNGQALYVNRGMGYIGFPGRIGLRPEIALLTLKKKP